MNAHVRRSRDALRATPLVELARISIRRLPTLPPGCDAPSWAPAVSISSHTPSRSPAVAIIAGPIIIISVVIGGSRREAGGEQTRSPTPSPTRSPTQSPTRSPANAPTRSPARTPTWSPASSPAPASTPPDTPAGVPAPSAAPNPNRAKPPFASGLQRMPPCR